MHAMLVNIFASISEAEVNYNFPKAYKLVQHDISLTCKYQSPHSLVKLPPFSDASCRLLATTEVTWFQKWAGLIKGRKI